jgi:hypothetical protein
MLHGIDWSLERFLSWILTCEFDLVQDLLRYV